MGSLFVSYRRGDSPDTVKLIHEAFPWARSFQTCCGGKTVYFFNDLARRRFLAEPDRYADPKLRPQLASD